MEILSSVGLWIAGIVASVSIPTIIGTVFYLVAKGSVNRLISRVNVQKIAEQATEKGIEKVKKVTFTHNIQPLCESELQKINEKSNEHINNTVARLEKKLDKVILIQEKQAKYFDNSIGVSEEAKKELKEAIEKAKTDIVEPVESVVVEETTQEEKVVETKKNKVSR